MTPVLAHHGQHGGQAEAGTVFLGGEERIEDLRDVLGRDAAGVVPHLELHVVAGRE